jgi:multiple sugar transport system permease protein
MAEAVRGILSPQEYKKPGMRWVYAALFAVASVLAVIMFYPFFWVITSALKNANEIHLVPPTVLPQDWRFENFSRAWDIYEFPRVTLNTLVLFAGFFASRLAVIATAAYSLSRLKLPLRRMFYLVFLATLMLPTMAYLVPSYLVLKDVPLFGVNLLDSFWALWLPAGADSFSLLLLKGFFDEIPRELSEAARIDGASELRVLVRVIVPLAKPIFAVLAIFAFLTVWNDFFWQKLLLVSQQLWTVPVMLWFRSSVVGAIPTVNIQLAAMAISIVPPMILFLFFQKNITTGVTMTGIKG